MRQERCGNFRPVRRDSSATCRVPERDGLLLARCASRVWFLASRPACRGRVPGPQHPLVPPCGGAGPEETPDPLQGRPGTPWHAVVAPDCRRRQTSAEGCVAAPFSLPRGPVKTGLRQSKSRETSAKSPRALSFMFLYVPSRFVSVGSIGHRRARSRGAARTSVPGTVSRPLKTDHGVRDDLVGKGAGRALPGRRKGVGQSAPTRGFSWYFESVACRCPWYFASALVLYGRSARSVV